MMLNNKKGNMKKTIIFLILFILQINTSYAKEFLLYYVVDNGKYKPYYSDYLSLQMNEFIVAPIDGIITKIAIMEKNKNLRYIEIENKEKNILFRINYIDENGVFCKVGDNLGQDDILGRLGNIK